MVCIDLYFMGYVEKGQWDTYSNGAWEFRATYVCIELRLGAYPFQKFRKYHGVHENPKKDGRVKYEPRVSLNGVKIYFQEQETKEQAAIIRDVAMFCLDINGRVGFNFHHSCYNSLSKISNKLPHDQIKTLILQYAKSLEIWQFASTLHLSNTPDEDATMVHGDEHFTMFHEVPLPSFHNQSQAIMDVEGGVNDINGGSRTPHGVEHETILELPSDLDVPGKLHYLKTSINEYEHVHDNKIRHVNFL